MIGVFKSFCKSLQVLFKEVIESSRIVCEIWSIVIVIIQQVIEKYWKIKIILSVNVEKIK